MPTASAVCPSLHQLHDLVLGKPDEAEAHALEQHLLKCPPCLNAVRSLNDEGAMTDASHSHPGGAEAVQRLLLRLEKRRGALAGPGREETESGESCLDEPAQERTALTLPPSLIGTAALSARSEGHDFLSPAQQPDEIGRLGPYRVLKVLGSGGMGVVFLAEDPKLKRRVALKAMKPALAASASASQRFLQEAQATAAIKHDHVITIHQVGEERDVPFLAMEFLEGEALDDRLRREKKMPLAEVLRIGREMAEGLQAAHEHGLIHRDVKPGNVWLEGKRSRVKILDFGLARAVGQGSHLTQEGAIVGTPAYMAPEQAQGRTVDARCDLFSLGVVLYRLGTGAMPFKGGDAVSTLVAIATEKPKPPAEMNPELPRALAELIERLLAKDPVERPVSAEAVAEALAAIEAEQTQPVATARPGRALQPASAAARPPRRGWLVAATAAGLLFIGGVFLAPAIIRIYDAKGKEVGKAELPDGGKAVVERPGQPPVVVDLAKKPGDPFGVFQREKIPADERAAAGGGDQKLAPLGLVGVLGDSRLRHWAPVHSVAVSPDGKRLVSAGDDKTVKVWDSATGKEVLALKTLGDVLSVALSSDGKRIAAGYGSAQVRVWDALTGKEIRALIGHQDRIQSLAFAADGVRLASGSRDRTVKVWDLATGKALQILPGHTGSVLAVAFSPDGKRLASGGGESGKPGELKIWDVASRKELRAFQGHTGPVCSLAFSADGNRLASAARNAAKGGEVKVWDATTGTEVLTIANGSPVACVAVSPDGKRLALAGIHTRGLQLWHAETGEPLLTFQGHAATVNSVVFSKDGKRLVSGGDDRTVRLWDVATGQEVLPHKGHTSGITDVAVSADGTLLASGSGDGTVRLWNPMAGKETSTLQWRPERRGGERVALSPDGRRLATRNGFTARVRLWDTADGKEVFALKGRSNGAYSMAYSSDGKRLVTGGLDGLVKVWDAGMGQELQTCKGHTTAVSGVAISPDGKLLVAGSKDGTVKVWDATSGKEHLTLKGHVEPISGVAFSTDGKRLVATRRILTKIWDLSSGKEILSLPAGGSAAYSPNGKTLATAGIDGGVILWDVATGKKLDHWQMQGAVSSVAFAPDGRHLLTGNGNSTIYVLRLDPALDSLRREQIPAHELASAGRGDPNKAPAELVGVFGDSRLRHGSSVKAVAFSPNGRGLASASDDNTVRVWDAATGKVAFVFKGHTHYVNGVAFSPDGNRLVSASSDKTALVWDAWTGKIDLLLKLHTDAVLAVAFSTDGKRIATASADRTVMVWDASSGQRQLELKGHAGEVTSVAFSADGARLASGSKDKTVKLWDAATGANVFTFKGHTDAVACVAFHPDGKRVASGGGPYNLGNTKVWEAATGKEIHTLKGGVQGAAFSPDGKRLATAQSSPATIRLWDAVTGKEVLVLKGHALHAVFTLAFSRDGKRLASGGQDHTVRVWNTATGKEEPLNAAGDAGRLCVAVSPDGRRLATATSDSTRLWDAATAQELFRQPGEFAWPAFSPDGQQAASGGRALKIWDASTGQEIRTLKGPGLETSVVYRPDGKRLAAAGGDKTIRVYDVAAGKELLALKGHTDRVTSIAFTPDGKWLASGSFDKTVRVWDAATGEERFSRKIADTTVVWSVAVSPDGKRLAACGNSNLVKVWDMDAGKELLTVTLDSSSERLAYSPNGSMLAIAHSRNQLLVCDAVTGKKLREWRLAGKIENVVFSPEGRHLLTGNSNGTVYVLRLAEWPGLAKK